MVITHHQLAFHESLQRWQHGRQWLGKLAKMPFSAQARQQQSAQDAPAHLLPQEACCCWAAQLQARDPLSWRQPSSAALPSPLASWPQRWLPCPPALKDGAAHARQPLPWLAQPALRLLQLLQRLQASPVRPLPPEEAAAQAPARLRLFWAALLILLQVPPVLLLQAWARREAASSSVSPTRGQSWAGGWSQVPAVAVMNEMPDLQT